MSGDDWVASPELAREEGKGEQERTGSDSLNNILKILLNVA